MKVLFCIAIAIAIGFAITSAKSLIKKKDAEYLIQYLQRVDLDNIQDERVRSLAESLRAEYPFGQQTHYCCKVPTKNETIEIRTKTSSKNVVQWIETVVGHNPCNTTGKAITANQFQTSTVIIPNTCTGAPIKQNTTYLGVAYFTETYAVPVVTSSCAPENVICCTGNTMVGTQCIPNAMLGNLQALIDAGIIIGK